MQDFTIFPLGDGALVISFGNVIDESVNQKVLRLFYRLKNLDFIKDVVPAYCSIAVYYDALRLHTKEMTAFERAKELLYPFLADPENSSQFSERKILIPVCYEEKYAPDIKELARQNGLTTERVIQLHTARTYRVYMIGFLPGFPYMGKVDERIATPRKSTPRTNVPAGAVGIAGEQTGVYPFSSPGGWNIIGRTPLPLFDKEKSEPVLLQPGDSVTFYSITEDEFENYQSRIA